MEEFSLTLSDGTLMKGHHWHCAHAKANFCMMTGMQEYSARYDELAKYLVDNGIEVYILDALGQGLNAATVEEQMRWPKDGFAKNVEGIAAMVDLAKKANGKKTIQAGHSMGSFMTQRRLEVYPHVADKTIIIGSNGGQAALMKFGALVAKMVVHKSNWDKPNPFLTNLGLGSYGKAVKGAKTPIDWLSYDENNVKAYAADPQCGYPPTGGFWREFLAGVSKIWDRAEMEKVAKDEKIFIVAGAEDPVGQMGKGPKWLEETYRHLGIKGVSLKLYPKMRHEIHNEIGKEQVWEDLKNYILAD